MPVAEFTPAHPHWQAYLDHLRRVNMLNSATRDGEPKPDAYYLGVMAEALVVGHIAIRKQALVVPATLLTGSVEFPLTDTDDHPLYEAFVQSFAVEPAFRRRGHGRALQEAALQKAHELACYQMRSWSSADRLENYALKIKLGFLIQPALYPMPGGAPISGVYFMKRLQLE